MSFLTNEPNVFINVKLTDSGRRQLSLGQLVFTKAVFLPSLIVALFLAGIFFVWIATLKLPDVSTFEARVVSQSTRF